MTGQPATSSVHPGHLSSGSTLAHLAVLAAAVVVAAILASFMIFGVAYLIGGWNAINDTWVGLMVVTALLGGLLVSFAAFVIALVVVIRHERWVPLWLPLLLFPAVLSVLIVGELFWWE